MDEKNPLLVSVIIPTAQRDATIILRAISSVLNQSYPVLEVIVVDDNIELSLSSEIKMVLKNIPQVRYIKNIGSHGACAARNVGISCAEGELIAFLDDDDEWLPEKIERQVQIFTKDVVLVYCNGWRVDDRCDPPLIMPYRQKKIFFRPFPMNLCWKRTILEQQLSFLCGKVHWSRLMDLTLDFLRVKIMIYVCA